jgi:hypothetical protein
MKQKTNQRFWKLTTSIFCIALSHSIPKYAALFDGSEFRRWVVIREQRVWQEWAHDGAVLSGPKKDKGEQIRQLVWRTSAVGEATSPLRYPSLAVVEQ